MQCSGGQIPFFGAFVILVWCGVDLSFSVVFMIWSGLVWCGIMMCSSGDVVVRFGNSSGGVI